MNMLLPLKVKNNYLHLNFNAIKLLKQPCFLVIILLINNCSNNLLAQTNNKLYPFASEVMTINVTMTPKKIKRHYFLTEKIENLKKLNLADKMPIFNKIYIMLELGGNPINMLCEEPTWDQEYNISAGYKFNKYINIGITGGQFNNSYVYVPKIKTVGLHITGRLGTNKFIPNYNIKTGIIKVEQNSVRYFAQYAELGYFSSFGIIYEFRKNKLIKPYFGFNYRMDRFWARALLKCGTIDPGFYYNNCNFQKIYNNSFTFSLGIRI